MKSPVLTGIFMRLRFRICNISCPLCDKCVVPVTGIWQLILARAALVAVLILQKEKTNLSIILSLCLVSVKYLLQNVNSHLPAPSVSRTFSGG